MAEENSRISVRVRNQPEQSTGQSDDDTPRIRVRQRQQGEQVSSDPEDVGGVLTRINENVLGPFVLGAAEPLGLGPLLSSIGGPEQTPFGSGTTGQTASRGAGQALTTGIAMMIPGLRERALTQAGHNTTAQAASQIAARGAQQTARTTAVSGGRASQTSARRAAASSRGQPFALPTSQATTRGATSAAQQPGLGAATRRFSRQLADAAAARPGQFFSLELGAGAGAGAMRSEAMEQGASPTEALFAEVAGGVTAGGGIAAAQRSMAPRIARLGMDLVRTIKDPGRLVSQPRRRAGQRLRNVENIDTLPERFDQGLQEVLENADLTVGEVADSDQLMSLQQSILRESSDLNEQNQRRFASVNAAILEQLKDIGQGGRGGTANVQESRDFLQTLMDERIRIARSQFDEAMEAVSGQVGREQASRLARREVESAFQSVRNQEEQLWEAVPSDVTASFANARQTMRDLATEMNRDRVAAMRDDLPADAARALGRFVRDEETGRIQISGGIFDSENPPTARELQTLRSTLMDTIRDERAKDSPNRRMIRMATQLSDSILADLENVDEVSDSLRIARSFSRDMNSRFRQGEIGDLLGFGRDGGVDVPESLTLEQLLSGRNIRPAEALDQLLRTADPDTEGSRQIRRNVEEFISAEFIEQARPDGEFRPQNAQRYLNRRSDVLRRMPELRQRLERAVESGRTVEVAQEIRKPDQSAATLVLGTAPGREVNRLMGTSNPAQQARDLRRQLEQDPEGQALQGFRSAIIENLTTQTRQSGRRGTDVEGQSFFDGRKLKQMLDQPNVQPVLREFFTEEQRDRLRQIANTAERIGRSRDATPRGEGALGGAGSDSILGQFARRFGVTTAVANLTSRLGMRQTISGQSAAARAADRMSRRGLDPTRELINDAVLSDNPQLLRALNAEPPLEGRRQDFVRRQLNAWAINAASRLNLDIGDENTPPERGQATGGIEPGARLNRRQRRTTGVARDDMAERPVRGQ